MDDIGSSSPPQWAQTLLQQMAERSQQQDDRIQRLETLLLQQNTPQLSTAETEDVQPRTTSDEPTAPTGAIRRPRARLPDPAMFGGNTSEWPTWRITIENKLDVDGDAIGPPRDQFAYVFARLEKTAWKNAGTFVRIHRENGTPEALLNYLKNMYGDPNVSARAARRLYQMRQGENIPFQKFLPKIEREFADAGAIGWPDEAKRQIMLNALNRSMTEDLISRGVPKTFMGLIEQLQQISADRDTLDMGRKTRTLARETRSYRTSAIDEMDWTPTVEAKRTDIRTRSYEKMAANVGHTEMQRVQAQWVSRSELDQRRENGTCLRCGREGCWISRCPYLPAVRPPKENNANRVKKITADRSERSLTPPSENEMGRTSDEDSEKE